MKTKKRGRKKAPKKPEPPKRISYYRKPDNLTVDQWQLALRKQFGEENEFQVTNIGTQKVFSDFSDGELTTILRFVDAYNQHLNQELN